MKRRSRAFTLLEVLIALALVSLLIGALFFWFRFLTFSQKEMKDAEWAILEERFFDQRISRIFTHITPKTTENSTIFFTPDANKNLVFHFDNGPHLNPLFAGTVLGELYLDRETHTVCLCIWPQNKSAPYELLPLLPDVVGIGIEFYQPPAVSNLIVETEKIDPANPPTGWNSDWRKEYNDLPTFVKITLTRPSKQPALKTLVYTYELPAAQKTVTFSSHLQRKGKA